MIMVFKTSKLKGLVGKLKKGSGRARGKSSFGTWRHRLEDWEIIFLLFVIINIIALVVGVLLFLRITNGALTSGQGSEEIEVNTFNKQALGEQMEAFENKRNQFVEILESNVAIRDPSR